jgi:hypothetical protein
MEESESEVLCTDSTALLQTRSLVSVSCVGETTVGTCLLRDAKLLLKIMQVNCRLYGILQIEFKVTNLRLSSQVWCMGLREEGVGWTANCIERSPS